MSDTIDHEFYEIREDSGQLQKDFAAWVLQRRTAMGVSQDYLGEMTGTDRSYISKLETGARKSVGIVNYAKIVLALGCEIIIQEKED